MGEGCRGLGAPVTHYVTSSAVSHSPQVTTRTFRGTAGIIVAVAQFLQNKVLLEVKVEGLASLDELSWIHGSPTFSS